VSRPRRAARVLGGWLRHGLTQPPWRSAPEFRDWVSTTFLGRRLLDAEMPWMTFAAMRWLAAYLRPTMSVFEWGSGGSTLFFARRVARVVSVEYDAGWSAAVRARLQQAGRDNVVLHHLPPEPDPADRIYLSSDPQFSGMSFRRYARSVLDHPDGAFDLVLVDGRARLGCVVSALPKLRPDGVLLLDNSEREDATEACALLSSSGWSARHFSGPGPCSRWPVFWRTSAFSRP
jgi:Methyltransferase domain